jgi:RNA polymerase sigma-70 factor (ECF subfamily)
MTPEEFYFQHIAPANASPEDYRRFFEILWHAHGEAVFKYAFCRLGHREDARDVCQDVFVQAMKYLQENPDRVPLKVNFKAWLGVIARNLIFDRFRQAMIRPRQAGMAPLEVMPVEEPPERRMVTAEDLRALQECLDSLTERARSILTMSDIEGIPEKEISAKFDMETNALYVALYRARKSLRECVSVKRHLVEA